MSKIIRTYADNQGKAMLIAALAAIFFGWLAFSPDAAGKSTLYYFLQVMAIPADLFKAVINLVVPILVSSAIFVVAAGGAKKLSEKDDSLAGKKMGFVTAGFLAFTTPIACLFVVIFLQFFNPAESKLIDVSFMTERTEQIKQAHDAQKPFSEKYLASKKIEAINSGEFIPYEAPETHPAIQAREKVKATTNMNLFRDISFSNMLQLVFAVLLLGFAFKAIRIYGPKSGDEEEDVIVKKAAESFVHFSSVTMHGSLWIIQKAMLLIPFVIFGLVATSIAESGLGLIGSLSLFMATFIAMLLIYVTGMYGTILTVINRPFVGFLKSRKELMIKAFTTSSSSAVMGVSIATARRNGIDDETANITIPMGATVNMDGTAMYQIFVAMFLMVISGVDGTDVVSMLPVILVIVLASMGTPGAPGASLFILMPILASMGIDTNLVLLILAVDRLLDMSRTVVNVVGDQVMAEVAYWWFHRHPGDA